MSDINVWTTDGTYVTWECESAYGTGGCLRSPDHGTTAYAVSVTTIKTAPYVSFFLLRYSKVAMGMLYRSVERSANRRLLRAYAAPTMPNDHKSAFPSTTSFTIPPVPTTFYPGLQPYSPLLSLTTYARREEPTPRV